jgi:hypothetical protein
MKLSNIDFVIIGATKSATTWLQRSLQADPAVFMPNPELHYFSREYHRGDAWYLSNFTKEETHKVLGEKSNSYLDCPEAVPRLYRALPHAKLVAQLRNPIDRAYSNYCMLYRRGEVTRDINRYLNPCGAKNHQLLIGGMYNRHLQTYLELYPGNQLLVLLYEDLRSDALQQLNRVRHFVGLNMSMSSLPIKGKVKDRTTPTLSPILRRSIRGLKPVLAPLRDTHSFRTIRKLFTHEITYPSLSEELLQRLIEYYSPETRSLGKLLGRDLSSWLSDTTTTPIRSNATKFRRNDVNSAQ